MTLFVMVLIVIGGAYGLSLAGIITIWEQIGISVIILLLQRLIYRL